MLLFIQNNHQFNTATDIVNNRLIAKSNVSTAIESLRLKRYLTTQSDCKNRRVIRIFLTEEAKPVVKKLLKAQKDFETIITKDISDEEIQVFMAILEKNYINVISALEKIEKDV